MGGGLFATPLGNGNKEIEKMVCTNCGLNIKETDITEDGYFFCNAVCRYSWRQKGKPNPYSSDSIPYTDSKTRTNDTEFHLDTLGFENRGMIIQISYWAGPKLFIDNKKLVPVKKKIFSRNREYVATSNFGKPVLLKLVHKPLDAIPRLEIEGKTIELVRPMNKWEYIWIFLPLVLLLQGCYWRFISQYGHLF